MIPNFRSALMGLYTLILATVAFVGLLFDPTGRMYMWFARILWGRVVMAIGGVGLKVKGGEALDWSVPYVVCTNHASQMDIPAAFAAMRMPVRFLAKKSLFFIPIFGWSMWLARFIPVDRTGGKKARDSISKVANKISKGPSLLVFPEGTRSPDGKVRKFKSGAMVMAITAGVPILPMAIRGSFEILPKDTVRVRPGVIEIIIGNPIPTEGLNMADRETLRAKVQGAVESMFETGEVA